MVEFDLKVNPKSGLAYVSRHITKKIGLELKLLPKAHAAAIYSKDCDPRRVIRSLQVIIYDLKSRLKDEADK